MRSKVRSTYSVVTVYCAFEILMKNAQRLLGEAAVPVIQHQIQQQAAVLPAGEGDIDIVELLKNEFQPFQKGFVYVLL